MLKTSRETTGRFQGIDYVVPADTPLLEYVKGIYIVRDQEDIRTIMHDAVVRRGVLLKVPPEDVSDE